MDILSLFNSYCSGKIHLLFTELKKDEIDMSNIDRLVLSIKRRISKDEDKKNFVEVISALQQLKNYSELLEHPIHINEYKDKYGNIYLQARTSIKDEKNKTKWINAYIGSLKEYPEGKDSIEAQIKGKSLVRKKLKKYYI